MALIALRTILELAAVLLLVYGFYKEDKVIAFERRVKMIVVVNYRRYKRRKAAEKAAQARRAQFTLQKGHKATRTGGRVA